MGSRWTLEEEREEIARLNTLIKVAGHDTHEVWIAHCHYPADQLRTVFRQPHYADEVYSNFDAAVRRVHQYLTDCMVSA